MRGRALQGWVCKIEHRWLRRALAALVAAAALCAAAPAAAQSPPDITSNGGGSNAAISVPENQTAVTTVVATNGPITFSLNGGADQARFSIGGASGVLTFITPPDFENPTDTPPINSYNVIVRATGPDGFDEQTITVNVTNASDALPVITSNGGNPTAAISVPENQTAVTTVTATNGPITFSLNGGADQARFSIGGASGVLTFITPPDFENPTDTPPINSYNVIVRATGPDGFDEQTITVNVTNVSDAPPAITSNGGGPTAAISTPENQTAVTTVVATNGPITFSLNGGADQARFSIGGASGVLTFITPPDFENPTDTPPINSYNVIVRATGPDGFDEQTITVNVTNASDALPVITSNGGNPTAAISVPENQTAVTTVTATNGPITFSLNGGADQARFSIGGASGVLAFITPPDFENPTDTPPINSYNVIVRATGPDGFDEQTITVNVTNVSDALPVITSNGGNPTAAISVPENQTAVTTVTATNGPITFSLNGGADQARFSIGGASGVLTFITPPDFENPTDTPPINSYNVIVRATGPDGFDEQTITVNVTNVSDAPPAITSNGGGPTAAISTPENQTAVTTVVATNGPITFSLNGGADQARFSIGGASGVLTFITPPDFENPTDTPPINSYNVIVRATGPDGFDEQTITVNVTNASDALPVITSNGGNPTAAISVPENQTAVTTVTATNGPITLSITGGADQAAFSIVPATGVLTFVAPPNFEAPTDAPPPDNTYIVVVAAINPDGVDIQTITVTVTNLPDAPPVITSDGGGPTAAISVLENQTAVTTVAATNTETGSVTFSLTGGADQARFAIVGTTGVLTFVAAPDFEAPTDADANNTYIVIVTATAAGGTDTQTITVTVTNANDPPVAGADSYAATEDTPLNQPAPGVLANDTDPENNTRTAQLVTSVPPTSGTLTLNADGSFVYTPAQNFAGIATFTYRAVDNGTPPAQSVQPATVTITVTPVNDAPVALPDSYTTNEDTTLSVAAPGLLANDTDVDLNPLTPQLVAPLPAASGTLSLNPDGSFTYTPPLDFTGIVTFAYRATDNGLPPLPSPQVVVTITVNAVNDPPRPVNTPPAPAVPDQTANEHAPIVPLALAPLFRDPEANPLLFTVTGLPPGLTSTPDGTVSGTPTLTVSVGEYTVSVGVSDAIAPPFTTQFKFTVLRADRTDLSLSISATPSPAVINQSVSWIFTIANRSPAVGVGNVTLRGVISGQVPLMLSPTTGCTLVPQGTQTQLTCAASPVPPSGSITIALTGSSTQPGDILSTATVEITDPLPVDDIATNDAATNVLNIAQSLASGPGQMLPASDYRASAAGDLNGDGFLDLVVAASAGQGTLIYPNVADATGNKRVFAEQPLSLGDAGGSSGIALVDLDGDGALDIITAKRDGGSRMFRNARTGPGSFDFVPLPSLLGLPADVSNAVAAADINGDARADIVLANSSPNPVFVNQGGGVFSQIAALGNDDSRDVLIADLYSDAWPELVFANANGDATVYTFNAAANGYDAAALATGPTTSVAAGDFDRDGRIDLVFGRAGPAAGAMSTLLFLNTTAGGSGQFFRAVELGASPTNDVLAVDTDADADLDIVAIGVPGAHKTFVNNGAGLFMVRAEQFASAGALAATAGKLSSDDRVDVAVTGAPGIAVFYNDGRGNLGPGDTGPPVITLLGQATINLTVEAAYTDAGATAMDAVDGDLTPKIKVNNPVNTAVIGTYTITYTVVDSSGNAAAPVTRTVNVAVRAATGGGGGGAFGFGTLLLLGMLVIARARSTLTLARARGRAGSPGSGS